MNLKHFITVMVGPLKAGKSQQSLYSGRDSGLPIVMWVPSPDNENRLVTSIKYVRASVLLKRPGELKRLAWEMGAIRVWIDRDAKGEFDFQAFFAIHDFPCFIILDDFKALFLQMGERQGFAGWASLVRHKGRKICITVQQYLSVSPPFMRSIVGQILVMGPVKRKEDIQDLYGEDETSGAESLDEFEKLLKSNSDYNPLSIKG